jgi:hypothetical protein
VIIGAKELDDTRSQNSNSELAKARKAIRSKKKVKY